MQKASSTYVPEGVSLISECLLWKHHDGAGVDRKGQPVVQVHVLQPVVIDLNKNRGMLFEKCCFTKRFGLELYLSELRPAGNGVKNYYSVSLPDEKESGREHQSESGSVIDFTELDELWAERSPRRRVRD